ncbi:hypothetical protein COE67_08090, partial [Priestia megaterium]|uniref:hypothetical protein n=1 Tax=Priestia megaterium TaxID=1404 RepID=UPI000C028ECC
EQTTQEETGHHLIKTNYSTEKKLQDPSVPVVFSIFKLYPILLMTFRIIFIAFRYIFLFNIAY